MDMCLEVLLDLWVGLEQDISVKLVQEGILIELDKLVMRGI
jgi:hypothetical protein